MHIAIFTFEGYNELDSLIALGVLNRVRNTDWRVSIASPRVRSMNGVVIESHVSIVEASGADAVIVGSAAVETAQLGRTFTIRNGETEFQRALANRDEHEHEHTRREGREKPVTRPHLLHRRCGVTAAKEHFGPVCDHRDGAR